MGTYDSFMRSQEMKANYALKKKKLEDIGYTEKEINNIIINKSPERRVKMEKRDAHKAMISKGWRRRVLKKESK